MGIPKYSYHTHSSKPKSDFDYEDDSRRTVRQNDFAVKKLDASVETSPAADVANFDPDTLLGTYVTFVEPHFQVFSLPSTVVGDHQELTKLKLMKILGSGSFGVVYEARKVDTCSSITTPRKYAVKCLPKQNLTPSQLKLQKEEVELLRYLSNSNLKSHSTTLTDRPHPNLIHLYTSTETPLYLFLIFDDVCDQDLYDAILDRRICGKGPFYDIPDELEMVELVKSVFMQVVNGVQEGCHERGIYHRDLKVTVSKCIFLFYIRRVYLLGINHSSLLSCFMSIAREHPSFG
jgi:hypothetical protein